MRGIAGTLVQMLWLLSIVESVILIKRSRTGQSSIGKAIIEVQLMILIGSRSIIL